ncbi:MAG TPA: DNA topoisomerase [Planctomycetota bacterium]
MQLVIAEKPSVAEDLARCLPGKFAKQEGYWEGPDYLVSWAVGHLLELAEPEDYDPELKRWSLELLPILPEKFRRKARSGQSKQLNLLKKLARRDDVDSLVNACDAAREGELIFREIQDYTGVDKPVFRLWLQSMTPAAIRQAFEKLEPSGKFDGLGAAAYSRAEADWLIGMNATRAITKRLKGRKERGVWSAGRVQTPTLALLVHRELRVLAHEPKPFWRLRGTFLAGGHEYDGLYRTSRSGKDAEKIWEQDSAEALLAACEGKPATVVEQVTESQRKPPMLHSLTSLQKEANSRYGLSARRTLAAAQRLYEGHKVLTYPRTDSMALPADYRGHVDTVLGVLAGKGLGGYFSEPERADAMREAAVGLREKGLQNVRRNFDDAKVSDHFAIVPTGNEPSTPLGGDDGKVFELVTRRFLAAFMGASTWQNVVRETRIADAAADGGARVFYTESKRLVVAGWQLVDRRPPASEVLPPLGVEPGEAASGKIVALELQEDATRPAARYTEAGLLKGMETASDLDLEQHEEIDDDDVLDALKQKGLGTPATRADTIESLIAKGYVSRSGKTLRPSAKGIILIDFLERIHADHLAKAQATAEMEFHLYQVEEGQLQGADYMQEVEDSVRSLVDRLRSFSYEDLYVEEDPIGSCPHDGSPVREGLKGYRCSKEACGAHFDVKIKSLDKDALAGIVADVERAVGAQVGVVSTSAEAKRTTAVVHVALGGPVLVADASVMLDAAARQAAGASLKELTVAAVEPDDCNFTLWKEFRGRYLNRPVAEKLLRERDTGPLEGFVSMRGDTYAGRVRMNADHTLEFEAVRDFKGSDDESSVAPELVSYQVDASPFLKCPRCANGAIVETPTHFVCRQPDVAKHPGCGVTVPRTVCKRELARQDLRLYFDPEAGHTEWIEDFISKKDRAFTARLVFKPNGRHGFEFKPREPREPRAAKKTAKKKTAKKKPTKKTAVKGAGKSES